MLLCNRCNGRMFIDRIFSEHSHMETFCIICGNRKFFNPAQNYEEGRWLLKKEQLRAKATIASL